MLQTHRAAPCRARARARKLIPPQQQSSKWCIALLCPASTGCDHATCASCERRNVLEGWFAKAIDRLRLLSYSVRCAHVLRLGEIHTHRFVTWTVVLGTSFGSIATACLPHQHVHDHPGFDPRNRGPVRHAQAVLWQHCTHASGKMIALECPTMTGRRWPNLSVR